MSQAKLRVRCFEGTSYHEATTLYEHWLHSIGAEPHVTVLSVKYDKDAPTNGEKTGRYYVLVRYKQEGQTIYTVSPKIRSRGTTRGLVRKSKAELQ